MKKAILAALVAAACAQFLPAAASDYYLVMPVPGKTVSRAAIQVALAANTLPPVLRGAAYTYDFKPLLQVSGDSKFTGYGVKWAVVTGSLPPGLALDANTGVLSGTPTTNGTWPFSISATYMTKAGQQAYQVAVTALTVTLNTATPPQATVGTAYTFNLVPLLNISDSAYNGTGVTWTIVSSTLPAGLTLRTNGTIAGTPTAAGTGSLTARATYRGFISEQTYSVVATGQRVVTISPAVNGKTSWNLDADGPLLLSTAGTWTITPSGTMTLSTKLWGAGGGGGGGDDGPVYSGKGGGGSYVAGQYLASASVPLTAVVGGGGGGGITRPEPAVNGGGAGGYNGGGAGATSGKTGYSGAGGGGGGRTELLLGSNTLACAGGGGGGGGDGNTSSNGPTDGNSVARATTSKTGATPPVRTDDGGGHGGGGGGCNGGGVATTYSGTDSNGEGGSAGVSMAPGLTNPSIVAAVAGGAPASASDTSVGTGAKGGIGGVGPYGASGTAGTAGVLVIQ